MKYVNNWQSKTLEILENEVWDETGFRSVLMDRCFKLRKKCLNEFTVEDLRIMISQQIGLTYLIPLAIEIFKADIFAEGDLYPGDLLKSVLTVGAEFWKAHLNFGGAVNNLIKERRDELEEENIPTKEFDLALS